MRGSKVEHSSFDKDHDRFVMFCGVKGLAEMVLMADEARALSKGQLSNCKLENAHAVLDSS